LIGVGNNVRRHAVQPVALAGLRSVGAAAEERAAHGDNLIAARACGAQSGARRRQFWFAAMKNGSSAYSGLTTMAMREEGLRVALQRRIGEHADAQLFSLGARGERELLHG